jgi:hypothetical protein
MLVTITGISTRNRVQRLVALGVSISIGKTGEGFRLNALV